MPDSLLPRPATLLKKRLWHRCFPVNFVKFLRTPFYKERLWWLLLRGLENWANLHVCGGNNIKIQKQPPEVFYEKRFLRNFTKFTGKHLCQSLLFNIVAGQNTSGRLLYIFIYNQNL